MASFALACPVCISNMYSVPIVKHAGRIPCCVSQLRWKPFQGAGRRFISSLVSSCLLAFLSKLFGVVIIAQRGRIGAPGMPLHVSSRQAYMGIAMLQQNQHRRDDLGKA